MKYEWIITGQEFFRQSSTQVGMLCGGMRNLESQNNVGQWNEQENDGGREAGPGRQERGRGRKEWPRSEVEEEE